MINPFQTEGTWLRCALHAHTTRSDGELQPEALVDHYERAEWDALAVTDHWTITRPPSSGPVHSVTERDGLQRTSNPPGTGSIVSNRGPVEA